MSLPGDETFTSEHEATNEGVKNETFHQAAAAGDLAKVSQFLDRGADVNSRDEDRQTALFLAVCNDSAKMVRLLLSRGADASLRDGWKPENPDGFTAIECAALSMLKLPCESYSRMELTLSLPMLSYSRHGKLIRRC
jgi:hypothetical protein